MNAELYTIHNVTDAVVDTVIAPAPTGYVYLGAMFNDGDIFILERDTEIRSKTGWHFSGQLHNHDVRVCYRGHVGHLLAEFTPTGFYRLTGIPAERVTNTSNDIAAFSAPLATGLARIILEPLSTHERVRAVDEHLCALIPQARDDDHLVASAARMLEESNGLARIEAICSQLAVDERQLRRRFRRIVGVTPKYFGQVRQINYAVEMLFAENATALTALALAGGFYDQSHFVKAMHSFFGQGPQRFLRSRHSALGTFLAQSRTASLPA
jgi:AraC-like DNA-binding protein